MAPPHPTLHALILCDQVIREAVTNKHSAVGIFTTINAISFPCIHPQMALYACLSDAHGMYDLVIELTDLATSDSVARLDGMQLESQDRLGIIEFGVTLRNIQFERPGRYEFRLVANGKDVGMKPLWVREANVVAPDEE